jgi:hypothetical protein
LNNYSRSTKELINCQSRYDGYDANWQIHDRSWVRFGRWSRPCCLSLVPIWRQKRWLCIEGDICSGLIRIHGPKNHANITCSGRTCSSFLYRTVTAIVANKRVSIHRKVWDCWRGFQYRKGCDSYSMQTIPL